MFNNVPPAFIQQPEFQTQCVNTLVGTTAYHKTSTLPEFPCGAAKTANMLLPV